MENTKRQVNAIGLACPQPVVLTKKALEAFESELEVLVDNEIAVKNVMKFAESRGFQASYYEQNEKEFHVDIKRAGDGNGVPVEAKTENIEKTVTKEENKVIAIASDKMGEGDPKAGHTLMKNFTYALTQLDRIPGTMVLYNSGALLAIEGSECLENLKLLEAAGMEILTCGDCLKFYGVVDQFAVGSVANMYTIAEKMVEAHSVIRP